MPQVTEDTSQAAPPRARPLTVRELARHVSGNVVGDDEALISGVSSIQEADFGDIVFAENDRFLSEAQKSRASAIVAFLDATTPDKPLIKVENPRHAYVRILELFITHLNVQPGIHPTAVVGKNPNISPDASIGAHVAIGDNVTVGARTVILPGSFVGDNCTLGEDCVVRANVTMYDGTVLGRKVFVHSGTVIGADGFGYMRIGNDSVKVPQIGIVEIGDEVEIGANCTIDRAKTGATVIGARTKIDNLVHIAHNVKLGPDCIIVAQVGIAGSTVLGRGVTVAGQAGLNSHIEIGDGAVIMGQAGVFNDVAAGIQVSGYPARLHKERQRQLAAAERLPEYIKRIKVLEKANRELSARGERLEKLVVALAQQAGIELPAAEAEAGGEG